MISSNLEKFLKRVSEDKECNAKAKSIGSDNKALAAYAKELGYDVTAEELQEYRDKTWQAVKGKIQKLQPDVSLSEGAKELLSFIKAADENEDMAKRLAELSAGTPDELIAYGKEKGFTFNEQDMQAVIKDIMEPSNEISDDELEMVAGGFVTAFIVVAAVSASVAGAVWTVVSVLGDLLD